MPRQINLSTQLLCAGIIIFSMPVTHLIITFFCNQRLYLTKQRRNGEFSMKGETCVTIFIHSCYCCGNALPQNLQLYSERGAEIITRTECLLISTIISVKGAGEGSGPKRCLVGCRTRKMAWKCGYLLCQVASPPFPHRHHLTLSKVLKNTLSGRFCNEMTNLMCSLSAIENRISPAPFC